MAKIGILPTFTLWVNIRSDYAKNLRERIDFIFLFIKEFSSIFPIKEKYYGPGIQLIRAGTKGQTNSKRFSQPSFLPKTKIN